MRGFVRASLLLFGTVAVGCGGEATGDDADAALSDGAAGKDVATDVRDTMPDPFVDNEAGSPADSGADEFPMAGDGGGCGTGAVTFQLNPGLGGPWQASTSGDEEPNWLAIFTASGARRSI